MSKPKLTYWYDNMYYKEKHYEDINRYCVSVKCDGMYTDIACGRSYKEANRRGIAILKRLLKEAETGSALNRFLKEREKDNE